MFYLYYFNILLFNIINNLFTTLKKHNKKKNVYPFNII